MAVLEGGTSAELAGVGVEASKPLHTVNRPLPYGALGHYRIGRRLVPAATTLAGTLWTFRNPTGSGLICVVKRARLRLLQIAAPTAAIEDQFGLKVARGYTIADTTGSADIKPAANMQELRGTMATATAQVREANIAAGASGGTKTLDTDFIITGSLWVAAAVPAGGQAAQDIFDYRPNEANGDHPLVLAADEGFYISNANNFGATSGIVLHLELEWAEVTVY